MNANKTEIIKNITCIFSLSRIVGEIVGHVKTKK